MLPTLAFADSQLNQAFENKGHDYKPRTRHINEDGTPKYINQLIFSESPYLLQHAHNPVNWHSWSKEAFAKAKKEDKPIFLSIGYSTCHWCHVMEHESFEDESIAEFINKHFIAIKVDREQMPDIDNYYMKALQRISGSGGWPMQVFLLDNRQAFHAFTYLPPKNLLATLNEVNNLWQQNKVSIVNFAQKLHHILNPKTQAGFVKISKNIIASLVDGLLQSHDDLQGGFRQAPKFPNENLLIFLLEQNLRQKNQELKLALITTLDAMANGGIYDQVGGGFHRYSVDNEWLVPHFEKMLYNQAMLIRIYTLGWRLTKNPHYQRIVRQTIDYLLRDMLDNKTGGFYSASDADSGEGEGEYFVWTLKQIEAILTKAEYELVKNLYGLSEVGNFEGHNILAITDSIQQFALSQKISIADLFSQLDIINKKMLAQRNTRPLPFLDKKIITAWNGLVITGLTEAFEVFGEHQYLDAAEEAAKLIINNFKNGNLVRIINSKEIIVASLNDYAFVLEAMIALYDQTENSKYLQVAEQIFISIETKFTDTKHGGYYFNQIQQSSIPRIKDNTDGAIYSATGAIYRSLQKLYRRTGQEQYNDAANKLFNAKSQQIAQNPAGFAYLLAGFADKFEQEIGSLRYVAQGHVKLRLVKNQNKYQLKFKINDNWHINSNRPLSNNLIPTLVSGNVTKINYPQAKPIKLKGQSEQMSLFLGEFEISFVPNPKAKSISLSVQACDDKSCLAPENLKFILQH